MITSIEEYLNELKKELSGCDRATVQDALADAEEHLRTALASTMINTDATEEEALARIVEEYGVPEETASAYRNIEQRVVPSLAVVTGTVQPDEPEKRDDRPFYKKFFGVFIEPRAWGALLYLLLSLATGIIYFTWVTTGLSVSVGLLAMIFGLPLALLFILSVRGIGLVEGRIVEALLGVRMPRRQVYYRNNPGWWQRFKIIITDKQTWLTVVYMMFQFPLGLIYFTVLVTLFSVSLWLIALPVLVFVFPFPFFMISGMTYTLQPWILPISLVTGILLLTATMNLAKYTGRMHGALAKALLVRA